MNTTNSPASSDTPQDALVPGTHDETIVAAHFTPSTTQSHKLSFGPVHFAIGLFASVALFLFWFLFTSKSIQLDFSPAPTTVSISGGVAIEFGGVYLLREGEYEISANSELHEPLLQTIRVGQERNQIIELQFSPLPGFLALSLLPIDASLSIDGELVNLEQPLEITAGQHELLIFHPRFISHTETVDIQGKKITQSIAVSLAPNWSNVSVLSTPMNAEIWIDGQPTSLTTPAIVEASAGEREISIRLAGFKTHRQRIFAQAGVAMELSPITLIQADSQLHLTSTPTGSGVTVNGQFVGRTPLDLELKSGTRQRITILNNGYESYSKSIVLKRSEQVRMHAPLVRQSGEVVITTLPASAHLKVNGQDIDSANTTLMLPIQAHQVSISLEGYAGYSQVITPKVGLTQEIRVKLLTVAEARLQALLPTITTSSGQNLKLFQPFTITMGASRREPGRRANETLHDSHLTKLFYLATHEVTNAQFREFAKGHDSGHFEEVSLNEDVMPVSSISWHEAAAYCNWLSEREQIEPFYDIEFGKVIGHYSSSTGYRLPSEAEWSWAARALDLEGGEAAHTKLLRFPWGSNLPPPDRHGNYADRAASALVGRVIFGYNDNYTAAAPIGTYKPNIRGLSDMGGNVAEWVHDLYEIPNAAPQTNSFGPASGDYRVIRGSSWMHGTITELRYSFRDYGIKGRQDLGFRIARNAE